VQIHCDSIVPTIISTQAPSTASPTAAPTSLSTYLPTSSGTFTPSTYAPTQAPSTAGFAAIPAPAPIVVNSGGGCDNYCKIGLGVSVFGLIMVFLSCFGMYYMRNQMEGQGHRQFESVPNTGELRSIELNGNGINGVDHVVVDVFSCKGI